MIEYKIQVREKTQDKLEINLDKLEIESTENEQIFIAYVKTCIKNHEEIIDIIDREGL